MNEDFSEIIAAVKKFAVDNLSLSTLSDEELEEQIKTITDNMIGNRYVSIKNRVDIAQQVFSSIRGFGLLDTIMNDDTIPEVFSYIGMDGVSSDITVTATAASCDGAEFVRNTDMVYDFVTFLSDRLHISDKISYLKEKVQGVFQEDAKEAANAAG